MDRSNYGKRTFSGAFAGMSTQDSMSRRGVTRRRTEALSVDRRDTLAIDYDIADESITVDDSFCDYLDEVSSPSIEGLLRTPEEELPRASQGADQGEEGEELIQLGPTSLTGIGAYDDEDDDDDDDDDGAPEPAESVWRTNGVSDDDEEANGESIGSSIPEMAAPSSLLQSVRAAREEEERALAVSRGEEARQWGEGLGGRGYGSRGRSREMIRQRNIGGSVGEMKEKWEEALGMVPAEFIEGNEAMMMEMRTAREDMTRGKHLYQGLPVYPSNNSDLNYMYKIAYAAKAVRQSLVDGSFAQMRSTFGQLCRFLVAVKVVRKEKLYKEGAFFKGLQHEVLELFLKFFILNAAPSTVVQKAKHCSLFCQHAMRFYNSEGMPREAAKVDEVLQYVRGIHSNAKSEDKIAMGHRTMEERVEHKKFLTGDQMKHLRRGGLRILHSICESFEEMEQAEGRDAVISYLKASKELLSKFSLNFLAVLVLTGGGQRPQVYSSLLTPTEEGVQSMGGIVKIAVGREKKLRVSPSIVFPVCIKRAMLHYVAYVRPAIVELRNVPEDEKRLILHTRYGTAITTDSVRATFKTFAGRMGEEFVNVTPMCIRSSYATYMLKRHREGNLAENLTEDQFFADLAKSMNTSPEMLRSTYVLIGNDEYEKAARYLGQHMNQE